MKKKLSLQKMFLKEGEIYKTLDKNGNPYFYAKNIKKQEERGPNPVTNFQPEELLEIAETNLEAIIKQSEIILQQIRSRQDWRRSFAHMKNLIGRLNWVQADERIFSKKED